MAINYSFSTYTVNGASFQVIKTHCSNLRSEVIKMPLCNTNYYGINGGVFNSANGYDQPPTEGLAISWYEGQTTNITTSNAYGNKSRGTFYTYFDTSVNKTRCGVVQCTTINDLKSKVGNIAFKTIIGGGDMKLWYSDSSWETNVFNPEQWSTYANYVGPDPTRTCLGFSIENNEHVVYLCVSTNGATLFDCRALLNQLGCFNGIHLDGNNSSQLQVMANGTLIKNIGSTFPPGRYIWNMVRLLNTN